MRKSLVLFIVITLFACTSFASTAQTNGHSSERSSLKEHQAKSDKFVQDQSDASATDIGWNPKTDFSAYFFMLSIVINTIMLWTVLGHFKKHAVLLHKRSSIIALLFFLEMYVFITFLDAKSFNYESIGINLVITFISGYIADDTPQK